MPSQTPGSLRTHRTLIALAERWTSVRPSAEPSQPFTGTPDLNDDRAIKTSGVLFMEGGGEPAEITRIKSEPETPAAGRQLDGDGSLLRHGRNDAGLPSAR